MGRWARQILPASGLAALVGAGALADVAVLDVTPGELDSLIVCRVATQGLPDPRSAETLESGLPAALVMAFSLLDAEGSEIGRSRVEVRIEPDLWEQVFLIRTPLMDQRVESLEAVTEVLSNLGPLPVLPIGGLDTQSIMRLRLRMAVHPLAATEVERVQILFGGKTGEPDEDEEATDRREVSVGFGSLVRYFLRGSPDENWVVDVTTGRFTRASLAEEP
jgi:hypothetical protein